jgi:hypothetical protein
MQMVIKGDTKTLQVENNLIKIIQRKAFLQPETEKTLPFSKVTSIQIKKPGTLVGGYIQFSIAGGIEINKVFSVTGGAFEAIQDENAVLFTGANNYETALKIKELIETFSAKQNNQNNALSASDEIRKFKQLLDDGIITDEEFQKKKKELLGL